jgi:hypothetical protein
MDVATRLPAQDDIQEVLVSREAMDGRSDSLSGECGAKAEKRRNSECQGALSLPRIPALRDTSASMHIVFWFAFFINKEFWARKENELAPNAPLHKKCCGSDRRETL